MPNKLTDAEIKKALAQCENQTYCSDCLYYTKIGCKKHLYQDALDLINRQEFRIHQQEKTIMEIQNANLIDFKATIGNYIAENESLKAEVERLNKSIDLMKGAKCVYSYDGETLEFCTTTPCPISKTVDQIKAEAYKECLEKVEQRDVSESDFYIMVKKTEFDNLLNELVGDGDEKRKD